MLLCRNAESLVMPAQILDDIVSLQQGFVALKLVSAHLRCACAEVLMTDSRTFNRVLRVWLSGNYEGASDIFVCAG